MGGNYHRKVSNKYRTRNWWRGIDFWGTEKINLQLQKSEHHSNTVKRAWADLMFVGSLRKSERTLRARFFLRSPWVPGDGQQIWKAPSQKEDCQLKICLLVDGDFGIRARSVERAFLRLSTNWRRRSIQCTLKFKIFIWEYAPKIKTFSWEQRRHKLYTSQEQA